MCALRYAVVFAAGMTAACTIVTRPSAPALPEGVLPATGSIGGAASFATGEPYLGLGLDDLADRAGMRVSALHAGPAALAGVQQGDRIVAVEGTSPDLASLQALLVRLGPGAPLVFVVERNGVRLPLRVMIGDRGRWSGPARHALRAHPQVLLPAAPQWQQAHAARLAGVMMPADAVAVGQLSAMLADVAAQAAGYNRSPWRDAVLADPGALAAWPVAAAELASVPSASASWQPRFCRWLALTCGQVAARPRADDVDTLATRLAAIAARVDAAFADWPGGRAALHGDVTVLLEASARGQAVQADDEALRVIAAMQASMRVADADLIDAFTSLVALDPGALAWPAASRGAPPAALAARVQGDVLAWAALAEGFVVVGGDGANNYDMDGLYAVIDSGGDDTYRWSAALPLPLQLIDDRGGDDRYLAERGGPAAGLLGVAVLRDAGGDDHYESALGGCGAGVFGFGLLIDAAGSDRYVCARWSSGAGLYGGGALLDAGDAADLYLGELLVQGIGGPAGVGLLIDAGGDDFYRANGPVPSAYATPGVFLGLAQGVGYGLRPHDHGGLGVLRDLGGDDRYEAGEFAQGGGYFGGLGLLTDAAGDDLYFGHRYAQGFAAHQAAGVLDDASGDDVYWSLGAAAQGAAWDQSQALLRDGGGNDHYRGGDLSQGAAAQQSRALLYDAAGDDVYRAGGDAQGRAGPNDYWLDAAVPVYSLGVLHDAGGDDRYDAGSPADEARIARGAPGASRHGHGLRGVALDDAAAP